MNNLADRFRGELTKPLISYTHAERGPWEKIWDGGRGKNERIPYTLAITGDDSKSAAALESAREYDGIIAADANQY